MACNIPPCFNRPRAAPADLTSRGSELRIFVLTFGPGDEPWEKFGHNAIEVFDPSEIDPYDKLTYNWGTFKFDDTFYWRFVQGRLLYEMTSEWAGNTIPRYIADNRLVFQQELNLTPAQKISLRNLLVENDTDEKRSYLYHYYRNNCTTRVRDVIDDLIDHRLSKITKGVASGTTYRWHTDRLTVGSLWLYVALKGVLGHPIDRPIDRWDEMFLPEMMHDRLKEVSVIVNGHEEPLILREKTSPSTRTPELQSPPALAPWFLAVGMGIAIPYALLGRMVRRHWAWRWSFVLVTLPWLLLMGLGGAFILWGWIATDHDVTRPNENVLHVSILALPLAVLLPMLVFGWQRSFMAARNITILMAGLSLLGLMLKALPGFYQVNWVIIALCLPPNLALAYVAWRLARPMETPVEPPPESH